jgi:hypothetical protein
LYCGETISRMAQIKTLKNVTPKCFNLPCYISRIYLCLWFHTNAVFASAHYACMSQWISISHESKHKHDWNNWADDLKGQYLDVIACCSRLRGRHITCETPTTDCPVHSNYLPISLISAQVCALGCILVVNMWMIHELLQPTIYTYIKQRRFHQAVCSLGSQDAKGISLTCNDRFCWTTNTSFQS